MKQILIAADGSIAREFVGWIARKRVSENRYTVVTTDETILQIESGGALRIVDADPTSYARIERLMQESDFSQAFIVLKEVEDARYTLKNIRMIDAKLLVVLLNQWEDEPVGHDESNIILIDQNELMAAHLFDHLPNVPLIAQNVGLGKGEIMEILIPFGSAYAYRHVGSILQRKWHIAAIYRDDKLLLPTNATMLKPNDSILAVGKPPVLDGVYKAINKRIGQFPEPFGSDLYLLLDLEKESETVLRHIQEAIYLAQKLHNKNLFVRVINPGDFALLEQIRSFESERVTVMTDYDEPLLQTVEFDISHYDIGLVMSCAKSFEASALHNLIYALKKPVYLFGENPLYNVKSCIIAVEEEEKMESISATAFDFSESLAMELCLCDFDPEGDFESKRIIVEHFETLSQIFNHPIRIEQRVANPVREIGKMERVLLVAPFEPIEEEEKLFFFLKTNARAFLLKEERHPKLLIPYSPQENEGD